MYNPATPIGSLKHLFTHFQAALLVKSTGNGSLRSEAKLRS